LRNLSKKGNIQVIGEEKRMKLKFKTFLMSSIIFLIAFPVVATSANNNNEITIVRDNYGVPHVFANTKEGLAYGCGYAMAQDRLWQADLYRRQGFGSLAEFFGPYLIGSDIETRTLGYSRVELLEIFDNWVPTKPEAKLKEMFEAYIAGINQYILEALTAAAMGDYSLIPIEYLPGAVTPSGLPLEFFNIEDSVAIVVMMAWEFGGTGGNELRYAAALEALNTMYTEEDAWQIFNDLYPQNDPGAEVTIPGPGEFTRKLPKKAGVDNVPSVPSGIGDIYQEYAKGKMENIQIIESLGLPTKFGSNAWVVAPRKSKTGNAMQLGGPQMGHSIPQIVLEVGLHGAGINAVGMMMPHAPTILIGVSEYGAWTSTTGGSDAIDTYVEVLNSDNPLQYLYNDEWVDMEFRTERIYWSENFYKDNYIDVDIYRTIHGPIVEWDLANDLCYSMKAPYYKNELAGEEGWSLFQQAENLEDFEEAVKTIEPSHNFLWADRMGNIGYWHAGKFPIKPITGKDDRLIDDRLPLWGTGEEEWVGLTGFEEMPKAINPPKGFLANWNNKPIANWPYAEADWGEGHRVKWLQQLLASDSRISYEDMNRINMEGGYNHIAGMNFLHYLVDAARTSDDPDVVEALPYLEAWDHHYNDVLYPRYPDAGATYDDPGLTIFDRWYQKIDNAVFDDDTPPGVSGGSSTLIHVFDGDDSKLPLNYDYLNGEDRDELIVEVLEEALAELESEYGSNDISTWLTEVVIVEFDAQGALPAPTMHAMNRGTYNHIAEMPRWKGWHKFWLPPPNAENVIPPGQSGFVYMSFPGGIPTPVPSPHAYDQLELYETWTYKPMLFRSDAIWEVAESWFTLTPPL